MEGVDIGNGEGWEHDKQKNMAEEEIVGEITEFSDLAQEFTSRLRECVPSHVVPFSSPPCNIGLIVFEFTSQCERNDDLVYEALESHRSDHSRDGSGPAEGFKEEHGEEQKQEDNNGNSMSDSGENSTELLAAHAKQWAHTTSHAEEHARNTSIDTHGSESDNSNTKDGVRSPFDIIGVHCPGVDVQVRNQCGTNTKQGRNDFAEEDVGDASSGDITGAFLRWDTEKFPLVTGNTSTRETTEANPRGSMGSGVTARKPADIVAVIDEEVGPGKLVRVEQEGRDAQCE
jgi:hypothetical protein